MYLLLAQVGPVLPGVQRQLNMPYVLRQVPPFWQGLLAHGLESETVRQR